MSDTIIEKPNAEVVIPPPGEKQAATDASLKEMQTMVENRYGKKPDSKAAADPKKPDAAREQHGIPELRKSRDEAIEKIKTHEKTLAERDTELTTLRKQVGEFDGTRKEYETLKARVAEVEKERDQYKNLDSIAAWESDPETHKKFTEPQVKAVERLKELAGMADLDPDELIDAVSKTGKAKVQALDALLEGASRFVSDDIVQTVRFLDELAAARADELANVDHRMQERRAAKETESRKGREERAAVRDTAWKITSDHMAKELGLDEKAVGTAGEFFKSNKDSGKAAEITLKGHAFDAMRERAEKAEAELAKYDKASPKIEAGVGTAAAKTDVKTARKDMIREASAALGWR